MSKYILDLRAETADTEYGEEGWEDVSFRTSVTTPEELEEVFQKMTDAIGFRSIKVTLATK
jgi:hypothetical protein